MALDDFDTNVVQLSTTAATIVPYHPTRKSVIVKNLGSVAVYVGPATVTAGNGFELRAGESVTLETRALIQGLAASGTPSVCYVETYS
jgi:hypothetical protein